ncbi:hypothetical protein TNCV_2833991 [Trichonephila clavipes]|nr:hypothetical protein TNCV_2833991 [Trichonephila clavipes]
MSDIGPFPGYFLDDKQYHSRQISWRLQSDDRLNLLSSENSTHAVLSVHHCDAHDTIANGHSEMSKRRCFSIKEKIILQEEGKGVCAKKMDFAIKCGIPPNSLSTVVKNRDKLQKL